MKLDNGQGFNRHLRLAATVLYNRKRYMHVQKSMLVVNILQLYIVTSLVAFYLSSRESQNKK